MGRQSQKYGFGQTLERGKFSSCVKQLETRLYKRKMKNFNNWYLNNCKSCLGNRVVFINIYQPLPQSQIKFQDNVLQLEMGGEKKSPKLLEFTLKKLLTLHICYIIFNDRSMSSSKGPDLVVCVVSHSAYFLWTWTRFSGGPAAAESCVFVLHVSYSVWQSRASSQPPSPNGVWPEGECVWQIKLVFVFCFL